LPPDARDDELLADDGVRYVPYVEQPEGQTTDTAVRQAAAEMPLPQGRDAGRATRALQMESRGMVPRYQPAQRGEQPAGAGVGL
jgi:hypothetical protein